MERKRQIKKQLSTALAMLGVTALTACGANNPTAARPGSVPGSQIGNGQCIPISQPIGFSGQGVYADYANLIGGRLPYSGQMVGQLMVGGSAGGGMYQTRSGAPDGAMSLSLTGGNTMAQMQVPYAGYPNQYTAPYPNGMNTMAWTGGTSGYVPQSWNPMTSGISGTLQISPAVQQDIMLRVQTGQIPIGQGMTGYPYGGYNPMTPYPQTGVTQNICVSGIAMNVGKWDTQRLIYGGQVYLYLNGTTHGYVMQF